MTGRCASPRCYARPEAGRALCTDCRCRRLFVFLLMGLALLGAGYVAFYHIYGSVPQ